MMGHDVRSGVERVDILGHCVARTIARGRSRGQADQDFGELFDEARGHVQAAMDRGLVEAGPILRDAYRVMGGMYARGGQVTA